MDTAFVIGNGESRLIFPLKKLQQQGHIYGCNAIYRDHPTLCDTIVAASPEMAQELYEAKQQKVIPQKTEIIDYKKISEWDYVLPKDNETTRPRGADTYRYWTGSKEKKHDYKKLKRKDFSKTKGSGCSAVLHAAEAGYKNILIIGFDILGARQWELENKDLSRLQNNVYKNTHNYPDRDSIKAYLKYEWLYQLTQIFRKFSRTNFYFINRIEYILYNPMLIKYFCFAPNNIRAGSYADLKKYIEKIDPIRWMIFRRNNLVRT
jgi:hypothetical protein